MSKSKADRWAEVHQRAMRRFAATMGTVRMEREQCMEDRRFVLVAGAQWEGPLKDQFDNKPQFETNKIERALVRIGDQYRNNRIQPIFQPKKPDAPGADATSDNIAALHRADEADSCAEEAYDNAFDEATAGGIGAWRLRAVEAEEADDGDDPVQRIVMEPIYDADVRCFPDNNAKRQDKADAEWWHVLTPYTREAYIDEWDDDPSSWPALITQRIFDWVTPDQVFVSEYYEKTNVKVIFRVMESLDGDAEEYEEARFEDDPDLERRLTALGYRQKGTKTRKVTRITKYFMNGAHILKEEGPLAGKHIPIVMVYGRRAVVDGVERVKGHVRTAKDAQRLKNMQVSKLAEISAYSSVEKPIVSPEQIAGHQTMWETDNVKNWPYLLLNLIRDKVTGAIIPPAPQAYTRSPPVPQAMAALLQLTEQDILDILGNDQQAEKLVSNVSERTVGLVQQQIDSQAYIYLSNMKKARRRSAEIWLSMAKDTYVQPGRQMKTLSPEGEPGALTLKQRRVDPNTDRIVVQNDLEGMEWDVDVDMGPSSSSKRSATVRDVTGMMGMVQDPDTIAVLSAIAMMNLEGEGLSDVRQYFRKKLLAMGAVEPTEEEKQQMAQEAAAKPEDPQATYLRAAAEEAQAGGVKARADTILAIAKAGESRAKAAEIVAGIPLAEQKHVADIITRLAPQPSASDAAAPAAPSPAPAQPSQQ